MKRSIFLVLSILIVASMVLAACAPATPEVTEAPAEPVTTEAPAALQPKPRLNPPQPRPLRRSRLQYPQKSLPPRLPAKVAGWMRLWFPWWTQPRP